jgi:ATP-dependent DNA ligase
LNQLRRVSRYEKKKEPSAKDSFEIPFIVARIEFLEWTPDSRLRHPRFPGMRSDKDAQEAMPVWLAAVGYQMGSLGELHNP